MNKKTAKNIRTYLILGFFAASGNYLLQDAVQGQIGCESSGKSVDTGTILHQMFSIDGYFARDCAPGFKPKLR